MKLAVNVVIEWLGDGLPVHIERVLFIDPSGTDMVTIDIDPENKKALPVWRTCEEISVALAASDARISDTDPYVQPAQALSNEGRKHRDEIWDIIEPLGVSELGGMKTRKVIQRLSKTTCRTMRLQPSRSCQSCDSLTEELPLLRQWHRFPFCVARTEILA